MRIGSLFSGIGGLELGLERAGVGRTVWQCEIDPYARAVLAKHWPDAIRFDDITKMHDVPHVDLICGGFPCQDISNAGTKRGISGDKSGLWREFFRIVCVVRPRFVVVENVAEIAFRGLGRILGDLAGVGLDAEWSVLPACALGAPFTRDRLFVVAYADCDWKPTISVDAKVADVREDAGSLWDGWECWPAMARENNGISGRSHRLKCLGNAVVPQVAEVVGRRVVELMASAGIQPELFA